MSDKIDKLIKSFKKFKDELEKGYDERDSVSFTKPKDIKPKESSGYKPSPSISESEYIDKRKSIKKDEDGKQADYEYHFGGKEPDKKTKNFLDHWEPKSKHPKEPTAGMPAGKKKGQRTTSTGFKMKLVKALADAGFRESALLLKNWDEMDIHANQMMEKMEKMSNYGPKKIGKEKVNMYEPKDNVKRKSNRTGIEVEGAGGNKSQKQWAKGGKGSTKSEVSRQAKKDQTKSAKNPVKTMKDFSPEEIKAMEDKANMNKQDGYNMDAARAISRSFGGSGQASTSSTPSTPPPPQKEEKGWFSGVMDSLANYRSPAASAISNSLKDRRGK